jgi:hypothetical protein
MFTTTNPSVPTIMYDIRIDGQMGTTVFPESLVYPSTPGTSGYQIANYTPALTSNAILGLPSTTYSNTFYINGAPQTISMDLSTMITVANVLVALNSQLVGATVSLVSGNLVVTSNTIGSGSTILVTNGTSVQTIFGNLPGSTGFSAPVLGTASGLELATAAYEALVA